MHPESLLFRALAVIALTMPLAVFAQTYPDKPITMVVVFAAGGTADIVGRVVGAQLSKQLGQQVVVDNKPGAGGTIGAGTVARAKPDGYTMLQLVSSHATAETMFRNRGYDVMKDLAPVSTIGTSPYWVLVNPEKTRAATLKDFVAEIRANPGKLSYAHGGTGDEDEERMPTAPNVPTMHESGFPGYEAIAWFGLAFPKGTPQDIVERMNREVVKAMADPEGHAKLTAAGLTPGSSTTAQFGTLIQSEIARWRTVISEAKITTE